MQLMVEAERVWRGRQVNVTEEVLESRSLAGQAGDELAGLNRKEKNQFRAVDTRSKLKLSRAQGLGLTTTIDSRMTWRRIAGEPVHMHCRTMS